MICDEDPFRHRLKVSTAKWNVRDRHPLMAENMGNGGLTLVAGQTCALQGQYRQLALL